VVSWSRQPSYTCTWAATELSECDTGHAVTDCVLKTLDILKAKAIVEEAKQHSAAQQNMRKKSLVKSCMCHCQQTWR
jgi:hypothetical protein